MRMGGLVGNLRLQQKAVAFPGNGLDIERLIGGIAKRLAEIVDGGVYVDVGVLVRISGPKPHAQVFAGDDITRVFEDSQSDLINLALVLEPGPAPGKFSTM